MRVGFGNLSYARVLQHMRPDKKGVLTEPSPTQSEAAVISKSAFCSIVLAGSMPVCFASGAVEREVQLLADSLRKKN